MSVGLQSKGVGEILSSSAPRHQQAQVLFQRYVIAAGGGATARDEFVAALIGALIEAETRRALRPAA